MNFPHELKTRLKNNKLIIKLKKIKNIEIVIAAILAVIAGVLYFVLSAKTPTKQTAESAVTVKMDEREAKLADLISEISGVGKAKVLITTGEDRELIGVVVVAEGANVMENRVKMIRCVEKATGATVDMIEIFEMENGG